MWFFHIYVVSFHFLLQGLWVCANHRWKKLVQSCNKPPSYLHVQTNLPPTSYKPMYTQNPKLELCSKKQCSLLFLLLDSIVFTCLPLMPSMFWHFCQVIKAWFMVVNKILPWNALKVLKVDHRYYLQHLAMTNGTPRCHSKCVLRNFKLWRYACYPLS